MSRSAEPWVEVDELTTSSVEPSAAQFRASISRR
jgi:hypothetical protein